jgi:hypothetical protein
MPVETNLLPGEGARSEMHEPAAGGETLWQPAHDANADRTGSGLEGRQRGAVTLRSPSTRARSGDGASRWLPTCSPEFFFREGDQRAAERIQDLKFNAANARRSRRRRSGRVRGDLC